MIKVKNMQLCGRCTSARCDNCTNFVGFEESHKQIKPKSTKEVVVEAIRTSLEAIVAFGGIVMITYLMFAI